MAIVRGIIDKAADQCVRAIYYSGAWKATKYVNPGLVVKVTRRLYGKNRRPSQKAFELVLTAGKPNYAERRFIKALEKAGEGFPVKKVQLKMPK